MVGQRDKIKEDCPENEVHAGRDFLVFPLCLFFLPRVPLRLFSLINVFSAFGFNVTAGDGLVRVLAASARGASSKAAAERGGTSLCGKRVSGFETWVSGNSWWIAGSSVVAEGQSTTAAWGKRSSLVLEAGSSRTSFKCSMVERAWSVTVPANALIRLL